MQKIKQQIKGCLWILCIGTIIAPVFVFAASLNAAVPQAKNIEDAVLAASQKAGVRAALLYGLLGQETSYGRNMGKTEKAWGDFCKMRNIPDCQNWKSYDCKDGYGNAKHFDEILAALGFVDTSGRADRSSIPVSSTCAMGFTQFEPNTWWLITSKRKEKTYNPWDITDAVFVAALYLKSLGADAREMTAKGEIFGTGDRIALQKYYCGGYYKRAECVLYAKGVEQKAARAARELLKFDLERQIEELQKQRNILRQKLELPPLKIKHARPETPTTPVPLPPPPIPSPPPISIPPAKKTGQAFSIQLIDPTHAMEGVYYETKLRVLPESEKIIRWTLVDGYLPQGLSFYPADGTISGTTTYTGIGSYNIIIEAENDRRETDKRSLFVGVDYSRTPLSLITNYIPAQKVGEPFSVTLAAEGGEGPYQWSVDRELPPGLALVGNILSGTPVAPAQTEIWITLTDARGQKISRLFPIDIVPLTLPNAVRVTSGAAIDVEPKIVERSNGDLFAVFTRYEYPNNGTATAGLWSALSQDGGKTWLQPRLIDDHSVGPFDIIRPNQELVLFARPSPKLGLLQEVQLAILRSTDGISWNNITAFPSYALNARAEALIYATDGYYYAGYAEDSMDSNRLMHKSFISRSRDLVDWETPIEMSMKPAFYTPEAALFQNLDKELYHAQRSDDDEIIISRSFDGRKWQIMQKIPARAGNTQGLNFLLVAGKPVLFITENGTLKASRFDGRFWSTPFLPMFAPDARYAYDSVMFLDGSVGFIAADFTNEARNIVFFNAGKFYTALLAQE